MLRSTHALGAQSTGSLMSRAAQVRKQFAWPTSHTLTARSPVPALPANLATGLPSRSTTQAMVAEPDIRFLVHHATMGYSVIEHSEAVTLGWSGYLEKQLDPDSIDDSDVESILPFLPSLSLTPSQLLTNYPDDQVGQVVVELQFAALLRSIYSRRQLQERMVAFWTDHFNIFQLDDLCLWFKTDDDCEVIRKHALGKFPDMLKASARSSAMLWYLDNYANLVNAPQENYSRELLELHTLGVDGPYTELDVKEVARCFTGWTIGGIYGSAAPGDFNFVPELHDSGVKTVLGHVIPAFGGVEDGEQVLEILATHPKTAWFISKKMCRWLLGYEPPFELIRLVAQTYLATGGDIKDMIRVILDPAVVVRIPLEDRTKLRQPLHFAISLMRAALVPSANLLEITVASQALGQTPYYWPSPDGPPDSLQKWGSSVLARWDFASKLFGGGFPENLPETSTLQLLMQVAPAGSQASQINFALTGGLLTAADEAQIQAFINAQPVFTDAVMREAFALAASCPSYQFF